MRLLRNIGRLFTAASEGTITDAAVAIDGGLIRWRGPERELLAFLGQVGASVEDEADCEGALVTPGLIDAHTHPVYASSRAAEIAARSAGASYLELASMGGGIASTVRATRAAEKAELERGLERRLAAWLAGGTTTIEAKTGYHLERAGELDDVRLLAEMAAATARRTVDTGGPPPAGPRIEITFLGAHAVPEERAGEKDGYADEVASWCADAAGAGARHCDVFCDEGYFTVEQSQRILGAGSAAGLLPRLHADELARTGGSQLAASIGAASADHLLRIDEDDVRALAAAGVAATLAPITALAMGATPPARSLLEAGATIALGTDHNPGTSGSTSMSLAVALAVSVLRLSVEEALLAATAGGATSLRLPDRGRVEPFFAADLVAWDAEHEGAFAWALGLRPTAFGSVDDSSAPDSI